MAHGRLGKVGNLGNLGKVIPSFLISEFSICPAAKIENSDLKIYKKKDLKKISEISEFSTWPILSYFLTKLTKTSFNKTCY